MLTCSPVWGTTRFDRGGVKEAGRKLLATLENTYNFFTLYANLDEFIPDATAQTEPDLLDRWILSRLQSVTTSVTADLEALNLTRAAKTIGTFIMNDVSNWYVRLSRRRFWKGDMTVDKFTAFSTLYTVLESSVRLLAPFIPFTAEEIFRGLTAHHAPEGSVHLHDFPVVDANLVDEDLELMMDVSQNVVSIGRNLRQESGLKTRQPLGRLLIHSADERASKLLDNDEMVGYVREELNIKTVEMVDDPRSIATLSAKANFRALGPRFGKGAPVAAKCITAMTPAEIMELKLKGTVNLEFEGESTSFTFEEVQVLEKGTGTFVAGSGQGLTLALDTALDEDLRAEGLCREIINKVQNLRKTSGLEVSDRIDLKVDGPQSVLDVVERFASRIMTDTLALGIASANELPYKESFSIDENEISIALGKA